MTEHLLPQASLTEAVKSCSCKETRNRKPPTEVVICHGSTHRHLKKWVDIQNENWYPHCIATNDRSWRVMLAATNVILSR